ncbi:sialidase family protein [Micromonospora sp. NBC_01796]|uniref:sialidase family protein n=1 Tax=Micromonospora sp. NBC_01796 TaxID=2975987 RepID=UPI002DDB83EF|nr:sialidase family protein [Micromonospora sp. NBC_01796]WSA84436.1 glycoside hydrolase [Micromonospora sp. NBC_01796]
MPDLDFTGLSEAARAAFRPQFAEVVRRAARRRRTVRLAGATLSAAAVTLAGFATVGLPGPDRTWIGGSALEPPRTPDFVPTPGGTPAPGEVRSNAGPVVVGDLDHLYVRWQDCRSADDCALMVAATEDGGTTWRSHPLPVGRNAMVDLRAVAPRVLVAWAQDDQGNEGSPGQTWHASTDAGATWHDVSPATVDVFPPGWRVLDDFEFLHGGVTAVDPVTGAVASLPSSPLEMSRAVSGLPPEAGLWVSGYVDTVTTQTTDNTGGVGYGRTTGTGSAVAVSRDGGRTWERQVFPEELVASSEGDLAAAAIATEDGQTVYAVGRVAGMLGVYRSVDGGRHWQRTAARQEVGDLTIRAALGPGGRLVIQAGPEGDQPPLLFESVDGGATVRPIPAGPGASAVLVPGGYAQPGWPWSSGAWLSPDGMQWSYVDPPEVP